VVPVVVVDAFLATRARGGGAAVVVPAQVRSQAEGLESLRRKKPI
jgi:hypothetical protein